MEIQTLDQKPSEDGPWWRRTGLRGLTVVALTMVVLATSCGDDDEAESTESAAAEAQNGFVGQVEGTNAFIAIVAGTEEAAVYVCDGESQISTWFAGPVGDPAAFELSADDGASISVELVEGTYSGTFTDPDGNAHTFDSTAANGDAGLYRMVGAETEQHELWGGWVIDNDGNERGALRRRGRFLPTPRFSGSRLSFDEADALFGKRTELNLSGTVFSVTRVTQTVGAIAPNNILAPNGISTGGSGGEDR